MTRGVVHTLQIDSALLQGNPWGDPATRDLYVYTPPGARGPLPAVLALAGFTGSGAGFVSRKWRQESLPERLDRLIAAGMPPVVVVMPDALTALGGAQYLDSPVNGPYARYIVDEVRAFVAERFALTGRWGITGKSSGAWAALTLPTLFPGAFHAVAAHSPDAAFDVAYPPDFPGAVETIREAGGLEAWLTDFHSRLDLRGPDHAVLNLLAMACAYSPEPDRAPLPAALPVDLDTGALVPEVFARWLAWDPVHRLPACADALRALDGIWLDVGTRDEFRLQVGARLVHRALNAASVPHDYAEHRGGHFRLNSRFDHSLPWLARVLSADQG
ncbi:MAG: hypothetical protein H6739_24065 [Alphaproteobacteria bacterium]|nr:hypothetical protein [Alphaproteobacteria bacterium]